MSDAPPQCVTLGDLLIAIAVFAPVAGGAVDGHQWGALGVCFGGAIGVGVGAGTGAVLLALRAYAFNRVVAMTSHAWAAAAVCLFYGLLLLTGVVSAGLAKLSTSVTLPLLFG
ncbi:MAG TPA: hypothetical protein VIK18_19235 [Pirellulales bacterium]